MNASRPNIMIFMVDQFPQDFLRPGHACRMDRVHAMAKEGVVFDRAYTPSPHCCPSRATFMTGCYPSRHGVFNNIDTNSAFQNGLNPGTKVFSEFLKDAGYHCAISGKWHVSNQKTPAEYGWEELKSYNQKPPVKGGPGRADFRQPVSAYRPEWPKAKMKRSGWADEPAYGETLDATSLEETPWFKSTIGPAVDRIKKMAGQEQPWCLYVSTDMVYRSGVPADIKALYDPEKIELPASHSDDLKDKPNIYRRMRRQCWDQLTDREKKESMAHYYAVCTMQDRYFGSLLDALDESDQSDNTVVLFVADHGDYAYAHGLGHMGIPAFRQAYNIPSVMRWPKGIKNPGRHVDEFITLADFGPTFLDLAGVETDYRFTGRSIRGFLEDQPTSENWPDAVFSQTRGNECYFTQRISMTKDYKYVANWFDFDELYDLQQDPEELVNLAYPKESDFEPPTEPSAPWPPLSPKLEEVRKDLLTRMWRFAVEQDDNIFNDYLPIAFPPHGPHILAEESK